MLVGLLEGVTVRVPVGVVLRVFVAVNVPLGVLLGEAEIVLVVVEL